MSADSQPEVVVVTGASAGIGRATVRRFAEQGARIGLLARGREALEATKEEVERLGGQALVLPTDVADAEAVEAAATAVEDAFGPIDIWINNAMVTVYAFFTDVEPAEFKRAIEVTYLGTVHGTLSALKRMEPRDRGTIVQVGSAMAYRSIPLQSAYCGSKHAVKGVTESVITELKAKKSNVHICMVELPGVNTPQFTWGRTKLPNQTQPVPPVYQPEVAADAIHWMAHRRRREMYVGVPTVYTILGQKVAPWIVDRYLAATGVDGQQTDQPLASEGHDNLFDHEPGDRGAHGPFDDMAYAGSIQMELSKRRVWAWGGLAALALIGLGALARD